VIRHQPGQYLTFRLDLPGHGLLKRNYSISSPPSGRGYRISVKREAALSGVSQPAGLASTWLHDEVSPGAILQVAPPSGEFVLEAGEEPNVLLSGGVGLTPLVSMLETLAAAGERPLAWFVHGAQNGRVHAMARRVRDSVAETCDIRSAAFYAEPSETDVRGQDYDEHGFITIDWLKANTPFDMAIFYLCGPKPFLRALVSGLMAAGVPESRIRYEFFGPPEVLLAA
jgi:nitric oxide dioxygenase